MNNHRFSSILAGEEPTWVSLRLDHREMLLYPYEAVFIHPRFCFFRTKQLQEARKHPFFLERQQQAVSHQNMGGCCHQIPPEPWFLHIPEATLQAKISKLRQDYAADLLLGEAKV